MATLLNLQTKERRRFARHFLNSVHCELGPIALDTTSILSHQDTLSAELAPLGYRDVGQVYSGTFHLSQEQGQDPHLRSESPRTEGLEFRSEHPRRIARITPDRIVVSDFSYEGFESFQTHMHDVAHRVSDALGGLQLQKLGFRKINSLNISPVESYQEACAIFNPDVFGMIRSGIAKPGALKASQETMILEDGPDICVLRLQLKRLRNDTEYEALLDFDLVNKEKNTISTAIAKLAELNQQHFDLFMWSITDEMIAMLEVDNAGGGEPL